MKVGLLIQNNLWFCPYVDIYVQLLKEWKVDYELIYWNRDGNPEIDGIAYNGKGFSSKFAKISGYFKYGQFLRKVIKENKYDRLIVFSPQIGIFISKFLAKNYSKRYIFDYRDLSIEQNKIFKVPFERVLDNSYANVISSPGFKRCLPKRDYIISHNFIASEVEKAIISNVEEYGYKPIEILTIGGIRDYDSNSQVIKALANHENISMSFVGRGSAREPLENMAKETSVKNSSFSGYYDKKDEPNIIKKSTFLNIYYPDKISHATALSNRFYNSLIYRRPMIVTKGQIQGDYAERYNVGISVSDPTNLPYQIQKWINNIDFPEYQNNCKVLLKSFFEDYNKFKKVLRDFLDLKSNQ